MVLLHNYGTKEKRTTKIKKNRNIRKTAHPTKLANSKNKNEK